MTCDSHRQGGGAVKPAVVHRLEMQGVGVEVRPGQKLPAGQRKEAFPGAGQ